MYHHHSSSSSSSSSSPSGTLTLTLTILLLLLLVEIGRGDVAKDRDECANQLITVATCLPFVGGEAKAPTKDCCVGFKQVIEKSEKCVCILVRDKDDPQLGLKFNSTLAAFLPTICHLNAPNITKCISLLHLSPNSTLAKEFESLGRIEGSANSTTPSPNLKDGTAGGGNAEKVKNNGGKLMNWLEVELLLFSIFSSFSINYLSPFI